MIKEYKSQSHPSATVVAVDSTFVKKYQGKYTLSSTSVTKCMKINSENIARKLSSNASGQIGTRRAEAEHYQIKSGQGEAKPSLTKSYRDWARRSRALPNHIGTVRDEAELYQIISGREGARRNPTLPNYIGTG